MGWKLEKIFSEEEFEQIRLDLIKGKTKEALKSFEERKGIYWVHLNLEKALLETLLRAIEKQIPTKLIDTWRGKKCPNCKEEIHDNLIDNEETKYCPNCGQRWITVYYVQ